MSEEGREGAEECAPAGTGTGTGRRRFFRVVDVAPLAEGYTVRLDGRPIRVKSGKVLVVPARGLAEALAEEWDALADKVDFARLPLTRLAFVGAGDGTGGVAALADFRAAIAKFAGSDLVCYRAAHPDALVAREAELWDPVLDWVNERFGTAFVPATGISFVAQPADSLACISRHLEAYGAFQLAALKAMTEITGSLFLALAVASGQMSAEAAWRAAQVDEEWQRAQWGADREAAARTARHRADFLHAARFFVLAGEAGCVWRD